MPDKNGFWYFHHEYGIPLDDGTIGFTLAAKKTEYHYVFAMAKCNLADNFSRHLGRIISSGRVIKIAHELSRLDKSRAFKYQDRKLGTWVSVSPNCCDVESTLEEIEIVFGNLPSYIVIFVTNFLIASNESKQIISS